jgi:flagellar basal body-associated protein FliL
VPGTEQRMEGGVAILLLVVIVAVVAAIAFALSSMGVGISLRRSGSDDDGSAAERPVHTAPTSVTQEKTRFVGVDSDDDEHDRRS